MVSSNWTPATGGGAEAYVADLTGALRRRGHEVAAVTLGIEGDDVAASVPARPHRLDDHHSGSAWRKAKFHGADVWRPSAVRAVERAVREFGPDVVHSHVVAGMSVSALTAPSRIGVAHVHTLHDHWLRCWRSTGTSARQAPCGPACSAVEHLRAAVLRRHGPHVLIGISQAVLASHAALRAAEATVIRHPAAGAPVSPSAARQQPVFGFLGQLNPNKGVAVFLDAAREMATTGARFVVAGSGRLQAAVASAEVAGLEYRGWVSGADKEHFFASINCLVVPSVWAEPAGLVVAEATVRGVPVIASNAGGLPEYVPSTCRPLLCEPGSVESLVASMRRFAAAPATYSVDPSEAGTWDGHVAAVLAAYGRARTIAHRAAA